jgi:DNA ligase (NAD+)
MNIQNLETQYLKAKIAYYDGKPLMSDAAFDILEAELKALGSKVIEQVGSKRKDFDFQHPNKMKSLGKFQMEDTDGVTNYCEAEFKQWLSSRQSILAKHGLSLNCMFYGPKFDGSAINIIYRNGKLESVLTRGDGTFGKDASDRFRKHLPSTFDYDGEIAEIRCEGVMAAKTFNEKYSQILGKYNSQIETMKTKISKII